MAVRPLALLFRAIIARMKASNLRRRARYLLRYCRVSCEKKRKQTSNTFLVAISALVGALLPSVAFAQVSISEIMYDLSSGSDSGREWVEVYNGGSSPVKLSDWKFFENGTNHKIVPVSGGDTLSPGVYAVIADNATNFRTDWPHFSGQLFDSAFSLGNGGEVVVLRNASSTDMDSASYQNSAGAAGDGNSLNRAGGNTTFISRSPSPGAALSVSALAPPPLKASITKAASKSKKTTNQKVVTEPVGSDEVRTEEVLAEETDTHPDAPSPQVAAASSASHSSMWWMGAFAVATLSGGALFVSRRFSKREWDIEEMDETG